MAEASEDEASRNRAAISSTLEQLQILKKRNEMLETEVQELRSDALEQKAAALKAEQSLENCKSRMSSWR